MLNEYKITNIIYQRSDMYEACDNMHISAIISVHVTAPTLISTPLTMLHYLIDFQIGMEYLHIGRVKLGFLLTCKIGTNP